MPENHWLSELLGSLIPGVWLTIQLAAVSAVLGLLVALATGIGLTSRFPALRIALRSYVEIFRGTSVVVQLFVFYYALPAFGITLSAFLVGVAVLALNIASYGANVVEGAIRAIPAHQWEASRTLGLARVTTIRKVILPQAARYMMGPFSNEIVELIKATSIVSLITLADLTYAGQQYLQVHGRPEATYGLMLVLYFAVSYAATSGVRFIERRLPPRATVLTRVEGR